MYRMDLPYLLEKIKAARDALPKGDATMETRAQLIVAQEIAAQAIAEDRGFNFVTYERLRRFPLKVNDAERLDELQNSAVQDIKEGSEWLPWYKMSLNSLCIAFAEMLQAAEAKEGSERRKKMIEMAGNSFYDHLMLCGIGPRQDVPETVARTKEASDHWLNNHFKERG